MNGVAPTAGESWGYEGEIAPRPGSTLEAEVPVVGGEASFNRLRTWFVSGSVAVAGMQVKLPDPSFCFVPEYSSLDGELAYARIYSQTADPLAGAGPLPQVYLEKTRPIDLQAEITALEENPVEDVTWSVSDVVVDGGQDAAVIEQESPFSRSQTLYVNDGGYTYRVLVMAGPAEFEELGLAQVVPSLTFTN